MCQSVDVCVCVCGVCILFRCSACSTFETFEPSGCTDLLKSFIFPNRGSHTVTNRKENKPNGKYILKKQNEMVVHTADVFACLPFSYATNDHHVTHQSCDGENMPHVVNKTELTAHHFDWSIDLMAILNREHFDDVEHWRDTHFRNSMTKFTLVLTHRISTILLSANRTTYYVTENN